MLRRSLLLALVVWVIVVVTFLIARTQHESQGGVTYAPSKDSSSQSKRVHWQKLNDNSFIVTFEMNDGRKLTCVEDVLESSIAMSCNWETFNQ